MLETMNRNTFLNRCIASLTYYADTPSESENLPIPYIQWTTYYAPYS